MKAINYFKKNGYIYFCIPRLYMGMHLPTHGRIKIERSMRRIQDYIYEKEAERNDEF